MAIFISVVAIGALAIVIKAFAVLFSKPRASAANNWKNEDFMAREEADSWTESQHHVGGANSAPPGIF